MDTIIIFIFNSIVPGAVIGLIGYNIYSLATVKRRPRYYPGQEVLGQNYKTKAGAYVKCVIDQVSTQWRDNKNFEHIYTLREMDKDNELVLAEDRIKAIKI